MHWIAYCSKPRSNFEADLTFSVMILPSTMVALPRVSADGLHARDAMLKASIADCMAMYADGLVLRMLLPTDIFPDLRFILYITTVASFAYFIGTILKQAYYDVPP